MSWITYILRLRVRDFSIILSALLLPFVVMSVLLFRKLMSSFDEEKISQDKLFEVVQAKSPAVIAVDVAPLAVLILAFVPLILVYVDGISFILRAVLALAVLAFGIALSVVMVIPSEITFYKEGLTVSGSYYGWEELASVEIHDKYRLSDQKHLVVGLNDGRKLTLFPSGEGFSSCHEEIKRNIIAYARAQTYTQHTKPMKIDIPAAIGLLFSVVVIIVLAGIAYIYYSAK